jgi:phosphomannomutase
MLQLLHRRGVTMLQLVQESRDVARCTAEISLSIGDVNQAFGCIENHYASKAARVDQFDGLAFWMKGDWRFSLKRSKTEDLVRLNFETKGKSEDLLQEGEEVLSLLRPFSDRTEIEAPRLVLQ